MSAAAADGVVRGWSRVLVIEDDPGVSRLVRHILELEGYEVVLADDGLRGVAAAQRQHPDAIVLDLMMPIMDGYRVLDELRSDSRTKDVPVVVLTAVALTDANERAKTHGAHRVVTKPFDPENLASAVLDAIVSSSNGREPSLQPPPAG